MKGERRHELQQNDLLNWVNDLVEKVKPYSTPALLLLVLVVVALGGWRYLNRRATADAAFAWDDLFTAMNSGSPAEVTEVAEVRPDSEVAEWSAVIAGDMYLGEGCRHLFERKATAAQELRKAVESYLTALKESQTPALRERATFGLARAYESLAGTRQSEGEFNKAIEYYGQVVDGWPDGAFAETSRRRREDLQRQATKEFYDRFAQYDPKPAYTDQPGTEREPLSFDPDTLDAGKVDDFSKAMGIDLDEPAAGDEEAPSPEQGSEPGAGPTLNVPSSDAKAPAEDAAAPPEGKPDKTPEGEPSEKEPPAEKPAP